MDEEHSGRRSQSTADSDVFDEDADSPYLEGAASTLGAVLWNLQDALSPVQSTHFTTQLLVKCLQEFASGLPSRCAQG